MKREKISRIIGNIGDEYIEEAALFGEKETGTEKKGAAKKKTVRRAALYAAACAALVIAAGSAVFAVATEEKEYNAALSFFEENGLSAEGLSRSDIKAVYRDVTTNSFSGSKTAEVIQRSVPGWEIEQEEPTPEELSAMWNRNMWIRTLSQSGIDYRTDEIYVKDEKLGYEVLDKTVVECFSDGAQQWTAELKGLCIAKCSYTEYGTVVWGVNDGFRSGRVALIDGEGKILWERSLAHGFGVEQIAVVLPDGDGRFTVISRGDLNYLCMCTLDGNGVETGFCKTEVGNVGIRNAVRVGDGFLVQLWNLSTGNTALLYRLDREGNVTDSFSYRSDDCEYYITDMAEFRGRIYLSAYAVPPQTDEGGRDEIANILDYLIKDGFLNNVSSEELTPVVRDNYTAVLLLCDVGEGTPQEFYSVKGSLGGKLSVNGDRLEWDVQSIVSTFFSPATSSFTVGGTCKVYRYSFDGNGSLSSRSDTGETAPYRR